jgi:UDP-perosamine 4-acetyltransferase
VAEAALSRPDLFQLLGFLDPAQCEETARRLGLSRLGDDDAAEQHQDALGVLGIGSIGPSPKRAEVERRLRTAFAGWAAIVHERATVSRSASVADGAVVFAGAVLQSGATIGRHTVVNTGAIVEHDAVIGDFVQVATSAVVGGGARVGAGSYIGMGASVRDHVTVGMNAFVAMGAVVVRDVADGAHVRGVPAR